ncbi:hypothetical protein ACVWZM_001836 [Bradyrhizobium sp. USDA 4501]
MAVWTVMHSDRIRRLGGGNLIPSWQLAIFGAAAQFWFNPTTTNGYRPLSGRLWVAQRMFFP